MSTQVQFRRGTTTQNNAFTGAQGELSVDTDLKTLRLHDGTTAGGGSTMLNNISAQTALNKTFSTGSVWQGNAVGLGYGGTGSALSPTAGAVLYSTSSGLALSAAGTSGQVLVSGGTGAPTFVAASSITAGTSTLATTATNIAGGSAGQLIIQSDTSLTTFITAGSPGTFLQSAGAGYAPTWAAGQVIIGSTAVPLGSTITSFSGLANLIMGNGSYGGGSISAPGITGSGPWTVTVTGITSTTGLAAGQQIVAAVGTGSLYNSATSVVIASVISSTSITVTVTGGTTPTAGTITGITVLGYLQVPVGTTAQRSWAPATGMIRYNSDQVSFEGYSSGAWSSLGGVSSVNKYTYIRAETSAGAANGDLDFFAQNAGVTAAVQVGQWNRTNLKDYTGTLVGTQTTQSVFDTTATTVNAFGAATTLTLGNATSATLTLRPGTVVGSNTTQNLYNTAATTLNIGGAATTLALGATTGTATIANPTVTLTNATALNLNGASPAITTTSTTASVFNATVTTLNIGGAATTLALGASTGTTTVNNNLTVTGNLTINGTTTTVNATTVQVADKNIELGITGTPTDTTANGGGITLKGTVDKTIVYDNTNNNWTSSEHWNLVSGKSFKIATVNVLDVSTVLGAATSATVAGSATTLSIGASTGTATINNAIVSLPNATAITTGQTTVALLNTTATTVNAFGAATALNLGAATGTTTVNNDVTLAANKKIVMTNIVDMIPFTGTTSSTTATAITTFPTATYRSGKLLMQVVNGSAYRILELLVLHDGTNVTLSENYANATEIQTATTSTTFTASISAGTLTVYATASAGTSVVKGHATLFKV